MAKQKKKKNLSLELKAAEKCSSRKKPLVHEYGKGTICTTDSMGAPTPGGRSPLDLVVDASEGFIPLWKENRVLMWKFDEQSLSFYNNPEGIKTYVRGLFADAMVLWGEAAPIRFSENSDASDFKLAISAQDNCNPRGCTLARAFFPDSGRHDLLLFPKMFEQSRKEQVDTMLHEIGHVFGLMHFFAQISEDRWPSEVFGVHNPFSIMNYGASSELTTQDKSDLSRLYQSV